MLHFFPFYCFSLDIFTHNSWIIVSTYQTPVASYNVSSFFYNNLIQISVSLRFCVGRGEKTAIPAMHSHIINTYSYLSPARGILEALCPVRLAIVCSWQEWSVGAMAAPAETSLAFTLQLLNSVAGSKKRRECNWDQ